MLIRWRKSRTAASRSVNALLAFAAACALGPVTASSQPAHAGDGYEGYAPARLIVHCPAAAHSISTHDDGGGLSLLQGAQLAGTGDTFVRTLQLATPMEWKPLLDDATFASPARTARLN